MRRLGTKHMNAKKKLFHFLRSHHLVAKTFFIVTWSLKKLPIVCSPVRLLTTSRHLLPDLYLARLPAFPSHNTFTLKMAVAVFAETLENIRRSTRTEVTHTLIHKYDKVFCCYLLIVQSRESFLPIFLLKISLFSFMFCRTYISHVCRISCTHGIHVDRRKTKIKGRKVREYLPRRT